ncbi:UvrD-helicase domain-containing protein [Spiroplasma poulsonii]|uniref:UvrD-helicase domain-containing protein n=1 Tax=Spiroplasma poulsonii TaxID=2138 RepID=UPI001F4C5DB9|nr:UvrD-helicase domain-containing protein [Spiroplasma poulsonii]UNF61574.1 UvrD-helicase domain-containing protein [Spiroplasma poulsonii]
MRYGYALNSLDFNDLILLTYKLFKHHPEVLEKWQNRFDYFLVDEFQDTNEIQFDIIKWLVGDAHNIMVVGDPDQTIYLSDLGSKVINFVTWMQYYFRNAAIYSEMHLIDRFQSISVG